MTSQGDDSTFLSDIAFDWDQRRYRVWLSWKSHRRPESDCYQFYLSRLKHLQSRLLGNPLMSIEYDATFQEQLQQGIIERIPKEEGSDTCSFLPHHRVTHEDKETTKLRVVLDGSARAVSTDYSLYDCLGKGPNLASHIFDILV